jgi:hypothetical protein
LRQRNFDQPLDDIWNPADLHAQTTKQRETKHQLNEDDCGKRINALPRPDRS